MKPNNSVLAVEVTRYSLCTNVCRSVSGASTALGDSAAPSSQEDRAQTEAMGNALALDESNVIVTDDPLLEEYKNVSVDDYYGAKENFDQLQDAVGDKMTVTLEEFDEIFSLICQDPAEHFELFDSWDLGKVDVLEVFAVVIVYCNAPIETKIPLLFELFDFDHSREISRNELVLLMLCTTRGLCKIVGLDRPAADELEDLTNNAFASIDRDSSGQISLAEFSDWVMHERSVVVYLTRFASTRVIYENQVLYDTLLKQLCTLFVEYGVSLGGSGANTKHLACSTGTCKEIIVRVCSAATPKEVDYLVSTMQTCTSRKYQQQQQQMPESTDTSDSHDGKDDNSLHACSLPMMINMDVFCTVMSPYVAFVAADEDRQHQIDLRELRVLLWLIRGKEPATTIVDSIMKSLDKDHNGVLSALEWVSYALENDRRTGNLSFTTQMQLLFTRADLNRDAALTLPELSAGLNEILMAVIEANGVVDGASDESIADHNAADGELEEAGGGRDIHSHLLRQKSKNLAIRSLVAGLANEFMLALDQNDSRQIEWYEFRQNLDYLEFRVGETKKYICDHVLAN